MSTKGKHYTRVLTPEQRVEMIMEWAWGATSEVVGKKYGVHEAYVRKAAARYNIKSLMRPRRERSVA